MPLKILPPPEGAEDDDNRCQRPQFPVLVISIFRPVVVRSFVLALLEGLEGPPTTHRVRWIAHDLRLTSVLSFTHSRTQRPPLLVDRTPPHISTSEMSESNAFSFPVSYVHPSLFYNPH